jgi:hypothetical protein
VPVNSLVLRNATVWFGEVSLAERSVSESFSVWFRISVFGRSVNQIRSEDGVCSVL